MIIKRINAFLQTLLVKPISTRHELVTLLKQAATDNIFDRDSLPLMEAVLQFGDMRAKDILLPRNEVDIIELDQPIHSIIELITSTGHSRFPVVSNESNTIVGILHSKDIIKHINSIDSFSLEDILRPPMFIPDMKLLDSLLFEMKLKHSHIAIVVDEFTNIAGIVTLEMIVEQIVGEIDDEYDADKDHSIMEIEPNFFRIKGHCNLDLVNTKTDMRWFDMHTESIGGFIIKHLGRLPVSGETFMLSGCHITIISADSRKIHLLQLRRT